MCISTTYSQVRLKYRHIYISKYSIYGQNMYIHKT